MENKNKIYDLEERTTLFAERIRDFCLKLPKNVANAEYLPQLIRAGSSPGANYIEANESIGDKDLFFWVFDFFLVPIFWLLVLVLWVLVIWFLVLAIWFLLFKVK